MAITHIYIIYNIYLNLYKIYSLAMFKSNKLMAYTVK